MRNIFSKLALTAGFLLAITFTLSCKQGGGDDDNGSSGDPNSGGTFVASSSSVKSGDSSSSGRSSSSGAVSSSSGGSSSSGAVSSSSGGSSSSVTASSSSGGSSSSANISADTSGTFKDSRDNQTYKWVKIGTQIWMAQNLNYFEPWIGLTRGNKCYDNKDANCEKYGRLYEWDDAIRVCPDGWHLPSKAEWDALISFVGSDAEKKLKSSSDDWKTGAGTDDYGFGALPSGKLRNKEFQSLNGYGWWWTSTVMTDVTKSNFKRINSERTSGDGNYYTYDDDKENQYSVRCVKGSSSSSSIAYGEVTDKRDNQKYKTVKIGTQTWLAQNLNYAGASPQKGYCYNNKEDNCNKYGRLYDWTTAMDVSGDYSSSLLSAQFPVLGQHQGICPEGWHLPTRSEWNTLTGYVGGNAGKILKARSGEWIDDYGLDIYGFGALPGGFLNGEFQKLNTEGDWWTSTENGARASYMKYMNAAGGVQEGSGTYLNGSGNKTQLFSVRCVED